MASRPAVALRAGLVLLAAAAVAGSGAGGGAHAPAPAPAPAAPPSKFYDVCIVGAGPAGVGAAVTLAALPEPPSVVVLEQQYTDPTTGYKSHMDYPTIVGWADRLGIRIVSAATEVPAYYTWTLLLPNGQPGPAISKSGGSLPNLDGAFVGLYKLFDSVVGEARLAAALAAPNVSESVRLAPELAAPMDAWLDAHGLVALQPVLSNLFSGFGYSHLWTVPAAYGLRFATPRMLLYLFSGVDAATAALGPGPWPNDVFVFEGDLGFAPVLDRALRTFGRADLVLNATVTAVSRPAAGEEEGGGPVLLTYTVAGGGAPATLSCGALLNTAAPTPVGLAYLGGLDTAEAAVFGRVMTNQYTTVAVALDPPLPCSTYVPSASLAATYLAQPGLVATALAAGAFTAAASADGNLSGASWGGLQPSAAAGLPDVPAISAVDDPALSGWPQSYALVCPGAANRPAWTVGNASAPPPRVAVAYSLSDVPLSAAEFAQRATAPFLPGRSATAEQVFVLAEYFPRASPAGMAAGWAADLSALQGVRRTWHAGGALTFWDVEQAARSGAAVAALLFPPPLPAHNPPPPPSKQPAPALPPPQLLTAWGSL